MDLITKLELSTIDNITLKYIRKKYSYQNDYDFAIDDFSLFKNILPKNIPMSFYIFNNYVINEHIQYHKSFLLATLWSHCYIYISPNYIDNNNFNINKNMDIVYLPINNDIIFGYNFEEYFIIKNQYIRIITDKVLNTIPEQYQILKKFIRNDQCLSLKKVKDDLYRPFFKLCRESESMKILNKLAS